MKKLAAVLILVAFVTCNLFAQNKIEYGSNPNAGKYINVSEY